MGIEKDPGNNHIASDFTFTGSIEFNCDILNRKQKKRRGRLFAPGYKKPTAISSGANRQVKYKINKAFYNSHLHVGVIKLGKSKKKLDIAGRFEKNRARRCWFYIEKWKPCRGKDFGNKKYRNEKIIKTDKHRKRM